ncbi:MAG TPA: metalloprotease PmbA [Burkholderiaceae bacterium]|nr:metalloprotease PmbA [Burkholderiaceae bacterium]
MSNASTFVIPFDRLRSMVEDVLVIARRKGATSCFSDVSEGTGLSVTVRKGNVETIEQNRDKSLSVTTYIGQRKGSATTSDFSSSAIEGMVQAALDIARYTAGDPAAGLPDEDMLERNPRDLALFYPWDIDATAAIEIAKRAEDAAFAVDSHIRNSEGANLSAQHAQFYMANSHGFVGGYAYSRHSMLCIPIAQKGNTMQRDDWYSSDRNPALLAQPEAIGRYAAQRALSRLNARRLGTRQCPVLFEAPVACGLVGSFVQATSGTSLYRQSSFLVNSLGRQVFAPHVSLTEDPHVLGAIGSAPFDDEGVRTQARRVVDNGVVNGWFLSSYSARKLGMRTTGNAGGSHNLSLQSSQTRKSDDLEAMLRKLHTGLLVTDLIGQGINYVTGDYSRGAFGYWVENGQIAYPVEEITIAGNLRDMFMRIAAIGADTIIRGTKSTGSILIEEMTVAGA